MKSKITLILMCLLAWATYLPLQAQVSFGKAEKFNEDWLFSLSDDSLSRTNNFDDSKWRKLDLPHDWSIEGQLSPTLASCTGYLPGGIGWYRKHFQVTDDAPRHYIYFEGAYNRSEVYLNGHLLGKRPNGYISFMYDMTPYLKEGENVLAVRIDHSRYADSRWYTGSGIYRDVWMIAAPETHFAQWGVGWQATSLSDKRASIAVDMQVEKHRDITGTLKVKATLYNKEGKLKPVPGKSSVAHVELSLNGNTLTRPDIDPGYSLGYDLGEATVLDSIVFFPWNDDNFVLPGHTYELFYYDGGWVSLGKQDSEDWQLVYEDVPTHALLYLRDHTAGKEERPFTYEQGRQVWW